MRKKYVTTTQKSNKNPVRTDQILYGEHLAPYLSDGSAVDIRRGSKNPFLAVVWWGKIHRQRFTNKVPVFQLYQTTRAKTHGHWSFDELDSRGGRADDAKGPKVDGRHDGLVKTRARWFACRVALLPTEGVGKDKVAGAKVHYQPQKKHCNSMCGHVKINKHSCARYSNLEQVQ